MVRRRLACNNGLPATCRGMPRKGLTKVEQSEPEAAYQVNVAADGMKAAMGRHTRHAETADCRQADDGGRPGGCVLQYAHRCRRCQRTAARDGQDIAKADIAPLRMLHSRACGQHITRYRSRRMAPKWKPKRHKQYNYQPFAHYLCFLLDMQRYEYFAT